jgi:hypothetical protein
MTSCGFHLLGNHATTGRGLPTSPAHFWGLYALHFPSPRLPPLWLRDRLDRGIFRGLPFRSVPPETGPLAVGECVYDHSAGGDEMTCINPIIIEGVTVSDNFVKDTRLGLFRRTGERRTPLPGEYYLGDFSIGIGFAGWDTRREHEILEPVK